MEVEKILERRNQYDIRLYKTAQLIVRDRLKILNSEIAKGLLQPRWLDI